MSACDKRQAYLLGDLNAVQSIEFETHLTTCSNCKKVVLSWSKTVDFVDQWKSLQPKLGDADLSESRLVATAEVLRNQDQVWKRAWKPALVFASVAAVLLILNSIGIFSAPNDISVSLKKIDRVAEDHFQFSMIFSKEGEAIRKNGGSKYLLSALNDGRLIVNVGGDRVGLGSNAHLSVLSEVDGVTRMRLSSGTVAILAKKRKGEERLIIEARDHEVEVTGTCFSVSINDPKGLFVAVNEGSVSLKSTNGKNGALNRGQIAKLDAEGAFEIASMTAEDSRSILSLLQVVAAAPVVDVLADKTEIILPSDDLVGKAEKIEKVSKATTQATVKKGKFDSSEIRNLIFNKNYQQAEIAINNRLKTSPRDVDAWLLRANCRKKTGQWQDAVNSFGKVIEFGSPDVANRARFSSVRIIQDKLGDANRAEKVIRGYLEHDHKPLAAEAMLRLARAQKSQGKVNAAVSTAKEIQRQYQGTAVAQRAQHIIETIR